MSHSHHRISIRRPRRYDGLEARLFREFIELQYRLDRMSLPSSGPYHYSPGRSLRSSIRPMRFKTPQPYTQAMDCNEDITIISPAPSEAAHRSESSLSSYKSLANSPAMSISSTVRDESSASSFVTVAGNQFVCLLNNEYYVIVCQMVINH